MNYKIKSLLWGSISIFCFSACSNDIEANISNEENEEVRIASIEVQDRAVEATMSTPPDGEYILYYSKSDNTTDAKNQFETEITKGTIKDLGKTGIKWGELKDKHFVLSNTTDITKATSTPQDILWSELNNATSSDLKFILTHRMAQVQVNLTIPAGWSVQTVILAGVKNQYTFQNYGQDKGSVIPTESSNAELPLTTDKKYAELLPPQERNTRSMLVVTVLDENKETKKYQSLLPYTMREEIAKGQWQDIPLEFKAGHLLKLNADIEENTSFDIHFTYATITDWDNKGTGHISARPAGLYSVNDIKGWIDAWNNSDEPRLNKYGVKGGDGQWTFTLRHTININSTDLDSKKLLNATNLILKVADTHRYKIIGIKPSDIGLSDETYKDIIVEKLTN